MMGGLETICVLGIATATVGVLRTVTAMMAVLSTCISLVCIVVFYPCTVLPGYLGSGFLWVVLAPTYGRNCGL